MRRSSPWSCALQLAGCGGGSSSKDTIEAKQVTRQKSVLGDAASAGTTAGYEPTGDIVADSGFRPWVDGFGFENYGNDAGPENMVAGNVEDIFGTQVCADGRREHRRDCELTRPPPSGWRSRTSAWPAATAWASR